MTCIMTIFYFMSVITIISGFSCQISATANCLYILSALSILSEHDFLSVMAEGVIICTHSPFQRDGIHILLNLHKTPLSYYIIPQQGVDDFQKLCIFQSMLSGLYIISYGNDERFHIHLKISVTILFQLPSAYISVTP